MERASGAPSGLLVAPGGVAWRRMDGVNTRFTKRVRWPVERRWHRRAGSAVDEQVQVLIWRCRWAVAGRAEDHRARSSRQ